MDNSANRQNNIQSYKFLMIYKNVWKFGTRCNCEKAFANMHEYPTISVSILKETNKRKWTFDCVKMTQRCSFHQKPSVDKI